MSRATMRTAHSAPGGHLTPPPSPLLAPAPIRKQSFSLRPYLKNIIFYNKQGVVKPKQRKPESRNATIRENLPQEGLGPRTVASKRCIKYWVKKPGATAVLGEIDQNIAPSVEIVAFCRSLC